MSRRHTPLKEVGYEVDTQRMINNREFKQIATSGAGTAAGSKFPPKCDTVHVRRLHQAVARNLTT